MYGLSKFIILEMSLGIFFNVTAYAASVFSEVTFLDCLHRFCDDVLGTFHRFYYLN